MNLQKHLFPILNVAAALILHIFKQLRKVEQVYHLIHLYLMEHQIEGR